MVTTLGFLYFASSLLAHLWQVTIPVIMARDDREGRDIERDRPVATADCKLTATRNSEGPSSEDNNIHRESDGEKRQITHRVRTIIADR